MAFIITHEDLHHDVNVDICNFAFFGPIFMKFKANELIHHLGIFCSFFNWEGAS